MPAVDAAPLVGFPKAPSTVEEAGLDLELVTELLLKTVHVAGDLTGAEYARRLGVSYSLIEPAIESLKGRRHVEILGGGIVGGASYRYRLTQAGREAAAAALHESQYLGVVPVALEDYRRYMRQVKAAPRPTISPAEIEQAFSHLVLSSEILNELGPAVNAGHSVFVYGPSGNGKTVISRAICGLLSSEIAIPHALAVERAVIRVFDPATHELLARAEPEPEEPPDAPFRMDRRWARCRRPRLIVGGELTMQALELSSSPGSGVYRAPVQMLANGGVLVIDDFGRERCSPRDLLDRWMVPLENGVDYLTLQSGLRIEVPFTPMVVFATNLRPADLVDEAFLRRVPFKVFAGDPSPAAFARIFERCCAARRVPFDPALVDLLLDSWYRPRGLPLRACHPRDLIHQALLLADYLGAPRRLTPELLEKACAAYFVADLPSDRPRT